MMTFTKLRFLAVFALVCSFLASFAAWAADAVVQPTAADVQSFLTAVGGLPGAGAMAIAAVVVQGLMLLSKSQFGLKLAGLYQLLLLEGLSLVAGVIAARIAGQSWGAALLSSQAIAAAQVFGHQLFTQVIEHKSGDTSAPSDGSTPPSA